MKPKIYKYGRVEFWAENGVVMVFDGRTEQVREVAALEFLKRGASFEHESSVEKYFDEANNLMNLACNVKACVDQALRQGDPTNERVSREMANLSSVRSWNIGVGGKSSVAASRPGGRLFTGVVPQASKNRDEQPRKLILPAGVS